jgi:flagellin-like protein
LTCLVSGWATYIGFSVDLPKLVALVLAVAIALFLTGLNFELRKRKRAASSLWGTLVMLAFVVIISFLANTNAIYSYQIRRDIVGQTQEAAWRVFDSETGKILRAIEEVPRSRRSRIGVGASTSRART